MKERLEYDKYKSLRDKYNAIYNRFSNIRLFLFIIMIISFILKYYYYKFLFNIVFILFLVGFIFMVIVSNKYFKIYDYYLKYVDVIDEYLARLDGKWKNSKDKGEMFKSDDKPYLNDLDIIGDNSLYQYLSMCETLGGRERLFLKVSNLEISKEELKERQMMIEELSSNVNFCINFLVIMSSYRDKDIYLSKEFDTLCKGEDNKIDRVIACITSLICISLFILGLFKVISMSYFYGMFFFNLIISFMYSYIYRDEFNCINKLVNNYAKLNDVFKFVSNYRPKSSLMKKYVKDVKNGLDGISKLKKLEGLNSLKNNFISTFIFNGLFCLNIIIRGQYFSFADKYKDKLNLSILNIEELESMISLSTIGIVKDVRCMPIHNDRLDLKFRGLKHPLIDEINCVSNDIDTKNGVNIITGSNMGGKTTFLRTIGVNLILMQAGTYVCGEYFSASYFKIFTSMRVVDDVDKGISTFYGELLRIKDMIDYNGKGNMLVLIDEIFKGTNYNDRMYGAKEVVKKLNNKKTIAFITTHDFELCDEDDICNYYVKESYEDNRIIFDFKVRKGKCISTNAKYLMKKLDIVN